MKDQFGNTMIQETIIDAQTGKSTTSNKKITKDKSGKDVISEIEVDENG